MGSPKLGAGLSALVGICLLAGWLSAFRNRGYLGWLAAAFLTLSGSLLAAERAKQAQAVGMPAGPFALLAQMLLGACLVSFLLAMVAAVLEVRRRLREIQQRHREAEEAMLEMIQATRERAAGRSGGAREGGRVAGKAAAGRAGQQFPLAE